VEWYHVCWPRLTAKRVEPVVSISWASCYCSTYIIIFVTGAIQIFYEDDDIWFVGDICKISLPLYLPPHPKGPMRGSLEFCNALGTWHLTMTNRWKTVTQAFIIRDCMQSVDCLNWNEIYQVAYDLKKSPIGLYRATVGTRFHVWW